MSLYRNYKTSLIPLGEPWQIYDREDARSVWKITLTERGAKAKGSSPGIVGNPKEPGQASGFA
jgi:hypothetical protein